MVRKLKRPDTTAIDPYKAQALPLGKPVSVYYRQSSEGQIGNISTTLQTVDMVEHLMRQGWQREQIHMIDMDAGISGQKKISERPGMSLLYAQIENSEIGLVAAQDVDRFFRDLTQIETNIFIDACRRNNVQVLTPTFVYDFAHPSHGRYHMQMFRDQAQRAADFIEYHVRGRLVKSRHWRRERGMWAGRKIAPGFMVDMRKTLPDGSHNPQWRKYSRYDPFADVVLAYFEMFHANEGNLKKTWKQIEVNGPFFPEYNEEQIPAGFKTTSHLSRRSHITGQLCMSENGLQHLLINVAYIGHWIHQGVIVQWHNHEAIIPTDLFTYAYNRISTVDFHGEPNEHYVPYRPWIRHNKADRPMPPPTYSNLVYSDDLPDRPHHRLSTIWSSGNLNYKYQLYHTYRSNVWNINTSIVDEIVDRLLLERLKATTIVDRQCVQVPVARGIAASKAWLSFRSRMPVVFGKQVRRAHRHVLNVAPIPRLPPVVDGRFGQFGQQTIATGIGKGGRLLLTAEVRQVHRPRLGGKHIVPQWLIRVEVGRQLRIGCHHHRVAHRPAVRRLHLAHIQAMVMLLQLSRIGLCRRWPVLHLTPGDGVLGQLAVQLGFTQRHKLVGRYDEQKTS